MNTIDWEFRRQMLSADCEHKLTTETIRDPADKDRLSEVRSVEISGYPSRVEHCRNCGQSNLVREE